MELALYCPALGYYERDTASTGTVGRAGDFFTSVSVGSAFGELLAHRFATWLREADGSAEPSAEKGGRLTLVEAGAHDGRLAADVLTELQSAHADLFARLEYWIVEPSDARRVWQRERLAPFAGRVHWAAGWPELAARGVRGVIFSNELLDAFPARRIGWDAARRAWFEWGVATQDGHFVWTCLPLRAGDGDAFPFADCGLPLDAPTRAALLDVLPDGYTIEVNPRAAAWWREAARALRAGVLVTFDYGLPAAEWFRPERPRGTLRAYRDHRASDDLLAAPGEQDLTGHVNFTTLQQAGEAEGLRTVAFETQEKFLADTLASLSAAGALSRNWTAARARQLQTLTHPQHLGRAFRVLAQSRP
ncbi:MAG: SAM-dependent methyltransferase [Verrucomicrobia bacterium]|nr:SAM-dependent methyltransferase [Verrucomicrobiota bacterium]